MANKTADRIKALEAEIEKLKATQAAQAPTPTRMPSEREIAEYRDQIHQARERAANAFQFRPEIQAEMSRACSTADLRDMVHASHRPQGPSTGGIPSSQTVVGVHPGGGPANVPRTGWRDATPLGPPPGIRYVDAQLDAQDARDRVARQKLMEGK